MTNSVDAASGSPDVADRAFLELIGQRIRAARADLSLTQKALGALAGVHDVHISRLEAGSLDTRISTLRKISEALQVPLAELLQPPS